MLKQNIDEIKKYAKGTRLEKLAEMIYLDDFENFTPSMQKLILANIKHVLKNYQEEVGIRLKKALEDYINDFNIIMKKTNEIGSLAQETLSNSVELETEAKKVYAKVAKPYDIVAEIKRTIH